MIIQEEVIINNKKFLHTYSDINHYILQVETNTKYDAAYDVLPCKYTYEESDEVIEEEQNNE